MEPRREFVLLHYLLALLWFTKSQNTFETVDDVTTTQQFVTADEITTAEQFAAVDDVTTSQPFVNDITTTQQFATTTSTTTTTTSTTTTQQFTTTVDDDIPSTRQQFGTTSARSTTTPLPFHTWLSSIEDSTSYSRGRPITLTSSAGVTHFYFYVETVTESGETGQTWLEAVETCQAMGSTQDSCYLFHPDERTETLRFLALKDSDLYSSEQWVNYYNIGNDIYSGRTDEPVSYPLERDVYIPWLWMEPNGTLYLGNTMFTHFKSEASEAKLKDFFCECEGVCEPIMEACRTHCCRQNHEQCTAVNSSTASCSCPTGS